MENELICEALVSARVLVHRTEPGAVVLAMEGAAGHRVNWIVTPAALEELGKRLTQDAKLLSERADVHRA
jgi:hypothetical protein